MNDSQSHMYRIIGGDQNEYGPASLEDLRQWVLEGRLSSQTLARPEAATDWKPLSDFPEFAEALRRQAEIFPQAAAANPAGTARVTGPVEPGQRRLRVGRCLSESAQLLTANFGLIAGASALVWLLAMVAQFTPVIGGLIYLLVKGVMFGGLYVVILKRIRGYDTNVSEVFSGFGPGFSQLMLVGFLSSFLTGIGLLMCALPGIYLLVAWAMAIPLAADRRLEFWPAMELSRRAVTRVWPQMALLLLLAFLPVILVYVYAQARVFAVAYPGLQELMASGPIDPKKLMNLMTEVARVSIPLDLLNKVVLLFNLPFAAGALMYAYEDLFGNGAQDS
jgi:hypothetical protein